MNKSINSSDFPCFLASSLWLGYKSNTWVSDTLDWWVIIREARHNFAFYYYCFVSLMSSSCVVVCVLLFSSSVVKGQKYESWVVLANAFSSEILHGLEFQGSSNEEKPMQQRLVFLPTKSQGYQINFLFAWKAGICFFFKCRAQVSWKKPTTVWIRSCPEKVFTWKGLIGAWRPAGNF